MFRVPHNLPMDGYVMAQHSDYYSRLSSNLIMNQHRFLTDHTIFAFASCDFRRPLSRTRAVGWLGRRRPMNHMVTTI